MSFSHKNKRLKDEPEYWQAFLTTKKGKSISRLSTWKEVNLQFSFFSTPIWLERMVICSITLIMQLTARLFSFSEKKPLRSDRIVVSLFTASEFELCFLVTIKLLIFSELNKLRSLFYSKFTLICAPDLSLAKVQFHYLNIGMSRYFELFMQFKKLTFMLNKTS